MAAANPARAAAAMPHFRLLLVFIWTLLPSTRCSAGVFIGGCRNPPNGRRARFARCCGQAWFVVRNQFNTRPDRALHAKSRLIQFSCAFSVNRHLNRNSWRLHQTRCRWLLFRRGPSGDTTSRLKSLDSNRRGRQVMVQITRERILGPLRAVAIALIPVAVAYSESYAPPLEAARASAAATSASAASAISAQPIAPPRTAGY